MIVYWATRLRGFLRHVSNGLDGIEFKEESGYYETNNTIHKLLSYVVTKPVLNFTGLFSIPTVKGKKADVYASFNRFLNADKPYYIYLENPTALYHYSLGRNKTLIGRTRFLNALRDEHLKGIACMSNACRDSFAKVNETIPKNFKIRTIYPLVPNNSQISINLLSEKSMRPELELLFCVQGIRFISKGGLETIEAYKELSRKYQNIRLTIITKISDISPSIVKKIKEIKGIQLFDFVFSYSELEKIYARNNILIQPTSDDSFALTVLEAIKGGNAIIASNMYAIPEMVDDGVNGYLIEPKYWFFDQNNIPNPKVWNHRKKTIYSEKISERLVDDIVKRVSILNEDRNLLYSMSLASYEKSINDDLFGENGIRMKWIDFFEGR